MAAVTHCPLRAGGSQVSNFPEQQRRLVFSFFEQRIIKARLKFVSLD
jgi:hypothetical protein